MRFHKRTASGGGGGGAGHGARPGAHKLLFPVRQEVAHDSRRVLQEQLRDVGCGVGGCVSLRAGVRQELHVEIRVLSQTMRVSLLGTAAQRGGLGGQMVVGAYGECTPQPPSPTAQPSPQPAFHRPPPPAQRTWRVMPPTSLGRAYLEPAIEKEGGGGWGGGCGKLRRTEAAEHHRRRWPSERSIHVEPDGTHTKSTCKGHARTLQRGEAKTGCGPRSPDCTYTRNTCEGYTRTRQR